MLRLAALLLEEEQRPGLLGRAVTELAETRGEVAATADGPRRATLLQLCDAVSDGGPPHRVEVPVLLADLVPLLTDLEQPGN